MLDEKMLLNNQKPTICPLCIKTESNGVVVLRNQQSVLFVSTKQNTQTKPNNMQIFVKTLNGKTITVDVEPSDYEEDVKHQLRDKGVPIIFEQHYFFFKNQALNDDRPLSDYIDENDTILLKYSPTNKEARECWKKTLALKLKRDNGDVITNEDIQNLLNLLQHCI